MNWSSYHGHKFEFKTDPGVLEDDFHLSRLDQPLVELSCSVFYLSVPRVMYRKRNRIST